MTPEQLSALTVKLADPDLAALSDAEAAAAINAAPEKVPYSRLCNERTLYDELAPAVAESILQKLEAAGATNPICARAYAWMRPNMQGIDPSRPNTREMIDTLMAAGVFTAEEGAALKGLGLRDADPVTHIDVARARGRDERC